MESLICVEGLEHTYNAAQAGALLALDQVSLTVAPSRMDE